MGIQSALARPLAAMMQAQLNKERRNAHAYQERWFQHLLKTAANTRFGKDHQFANIRSYADFKERIPLRDYEALRSYIDLIVKGEEHVLWPGKPAYLAKTSGTTSGVKYIPITKASIPYHISGARNALLAYIAETGNSKFLDGKLIFLSGSPELEEKAGIPTGRLSGIVNHHVPGYLRRNQMPSYATNCMEDWEQKVEQITQETLQENMTLISGIPPWVQMYFDKILEKTGKKNVLEVFPEFSLFVYGGVNFEPYRNKLEASIGRRIDTLETYPASEGFIAFQDTRNEEGLLLLVNQGIFYEFIPVDEYFSDNPRRLRLQEVEVGVNYAVVLNTNAGLFGYSIGDTVRFVSTNPYRILVTGRIKHFISAFGEHVIGEEVEGAMKQVADKHRVRITEFTVAPQVTPPEGGLPYHEWLVAFEVPPADPAGFAADLDAAMQKQNIYYADLLEGTILQSLKVRTLSPDAFIHYMKSQGKLGGQNKVPRLSNDRKIADALLQAAQQQQP